MVGRTLLLKLADSPRVERFVRHSGLSQPLTRRFVAGETLEEALVRVRALNSQGLAVTLDRLGENVHNPDQAGESLAAILGIVSFIAEHRLQANVSLKLTQLGLDISDGLAESGLRAILERADEHGQFVRVDMEGSPYTDRTLAMLDRVRADYRNVGAVIQSYLRRSAEDVERLMRDGVRIRLVKGAYSEPTDLAFPGKADVDASFARLMKRLLEAGDYPAIATHDERLIGACRAFAAERGIDPARYEFQMLYGIRRDLQVSLAGAGHPMRIYTPFGTEWYGYMMRRLAERPANLWFVVKNLLRR